MERKLKPIIVAQVLRGKGLRLFSPEEFRRLFAVTRRAAQEFIKDHTQDLFLKVRNGLYALRSDPPYELEIANKLYGPSYVSFEYALAHYRIIPETVYSVTSATSKTTRTFAVQGKTFEYSKIKKNAYTGYHLVESNGTKVLMASPAKAFVDYCYFVSLGKKSMNPRLRGQGLKRAEVLRCARLFGRPSLIKLVREVL